MNYVLLNFMFKLYIFMNYSFVFCLSHVTFYCFYKLCNSVFSYVIRYIFILIKYNVACQLSKKEKLMWH
jgi:hypothetical protein